MSDNIFFSSDPHFGHPGVIRYCTRPYPHADAMDIALIKNWNATVGKTDTVYLLGDVFFCKRDRALWIASQLNGRKHWIFGNHDKKSRKWKEVASLFESVGDYKEVKVNDSEGEYRKWGSHNKIILSHFPFASWNGMGHDSWHLHGHSHGSYKIPHGKILDVGVDVWDYKPVSYEQVKEYMKTRRFKPIDGHGLRKEKKYE